MKRVQLSHGGGGKEMNQLITKLFFAIWAMTFFYAMRMLRYLAVRAR